MCQFSENGEAGLTKLTREKAALTTLNIIKTYKKKPQYCYWGVNKKTLATTYSSNLLWLVPSATSVLTSEFGMGSGVSHSLWPPGKFVES